GYTRSGCGSKAVPAPCDAAEPALCEAAGAPRPATPAAEPVASCRSYAARRVGDDSTSHASAMRVTSAAADWAAAD
ncbi:MAG: hypothetical protein EBX76_06725, partial [Acidimicrobiia bacterium]|nr:hypothetical protein [Acidimicrobiia bacterium]